MDVGKVLEAAGLTNPQVRVFVGHWARHTGAAAVEVVAAGDDARLSAEALAAGEIRRVVGGRWFARSHRKDTVRSEERTFVATGDPADQGMHNNWLPVGQAQAAVEDRMRGASTGRTMYVVPYLLGPPGSPLQGWAAGVQLTDSRLVALQLIRLARVGAQHVNQLADPGGFVRAVHVTGDLDRLGQGSAADRRWLVTVPERRTILHFGSAHGDNAVLCRVAHGLRLACWDGWRSGRFLAESFMLVRITDKATGRRYHVCGGFPSGSGKTDLAMMQVPAELSGRWQVDFYGDDIAWLWVDEQGRLRAVNPEFGVFGVARDTNWTTNPAAMEAIGPCTGTLFTDVAHNEFVQAVWWEGRTFRPPTNTTGWRDWTGRLVSTRPPQWTDLNWAHSDSRFTTRVGNVPNLAADFADPAGVPIDAIVLGGRTGDREPLIRAISDPAEGIYDGLCLGSQAAFGPEGCLRYDPMAMRAYLSYPEADYAAHWLRIIGAAREKPIFAHVNWFARDAEGRFLWPGYRDDLRPLLWLLALRNGEVTGRQTPVGIVPTPDELDLTGLQLSPGDLEALLTVDMSRWQQEMTHRRRHLEQFAGLPEAIWAAHHRVAAALDAAAPAESDRAPR
ncbi:MAG TPA: phosphoenolpyruvate carboxykinase (GTP) [Sporichthyaceae bacterium]|nr:phosphoenolpyruvate carboxykinase (GTP) [Sporichthyaceae bacterium]